MWQSYHVHDIYNFPLTEPTGPLIIFLKISDAAALRHKNWKKASKTTDGKIIVKSSKNLIRLCKCQSRWPRGLRRGSAAARLLGLRVRFPPRAWMSVFCECCLLSRRDLYDDPITRPEESYCLWCVWVSSWSLGSDEVWLVRGCFIMGRNLLSLLELHTDKLCSVTHTHTHTHTHTYIYIYIYV